MRRPWPSKRISRGWCFGISLKVASPLSVCADRSSCVTRMRFRFVLAIASLFLSLSISADNRSLECVGCWKALPNSPTVDESLGVNIHFTEPKPGEVKMMADAGFRWVRMDFKWDVTEPEVGRYDFSAYDRLLKELEANHLRAMFILDYGNPAYEQTSPRTQASRQA